MTTVTNRRGKKKIADDIGTEMKQHVQQQAALSKNKRRPATRLMWECIKSLQHTVVVAISATRGNARAGFSLIRLISSPGIV